MRGFPAKLWPSRKQELLLRAVFAPEPEAEEAWHQLLPTFDLDRLEDGSFALMPLLYKRIEVRSGEDPLLPRLKGLYRHTWYRNNVLLERLREVLRIASVGDVLVGGEPRLLVGAYRDNGLRPSTRIDLLVRPEAIRQLIRALDGVGWHRPSQARVSERDRTFWLERAGAPPVALQRRLVLRRAPSRAEQEPWRHAVDLELNGLAHPAVSASDELLRLCIGEERRFVWNKLQWIADAKLLLDAEGEHVDWDRTLGLAAAYHATLPFLEALNYVQDRVGAAVPHDVLVRLEHTRTTPRERLAHRLSRIDQSSARRALRRVLPF